MATRRVMGSGQGREQARRRFAVVREADPDTPISKREFTLDDLMEPGGRGRAHAAARQGNHAARAALAQLARAIDHLETDPPDDAA